MRNALPTVTYPNHTSLITGVWPAKHGIANNTVFDPEQKNLGGWYWYAEEIKVPTLWDAVHKAQRPVASISWPVSVGAPAIDYCLPEYWRAGTPDDLKLIRALSSPGLIVELEQRTGLTLADVVGQTAKSDDGRAAFAAALVGIKRPAFFTLHLVSLDHAEHEYGPGSPEADRTLESIDAAVGRLVAAGREAEPNLIVAIVSDHGFAPVTHDVNVIGQFSAEGLMTIDPNTRKVTSWLAAPWGGASAAVILARPDDTALRDKVADLLTALAAKPEFGIAHVADAGEIAKIGGTPRASFWVDVKPGYKMGQDSRAPQQSTSRDKGTHGYFPEHPEMRSTFIVSGPGLARTGSLGEIDMRDIAPTLAKRVGLSLPTADGKNLLP